VQFDPGSVFFTSLKPRALLAATKPPEAEQANETPCSTGKYYFNRKIFLLAKELIG
jgi:hypothetical protein